MRKEQNNKLELTRKVDKWIRKRWNKIAIFTLSLLAPVTLFGQIHFEQSLNWQQMKEKARKEHKYIFVDCYATWCGPCKKMDQEVYPDTALGKFINPLFVSVKVQTDTSKNDNEQVKVWYADAHQISSEYQVNTLPTFLFFSPNGELLRKASSARPTLDFLKLALNATNPDKQEYALLSKFRNGKLPDSAMPSLITLLENANDQIDAREVAHVYIDSYLLKLPDDLLYKRDNVLLMGRYLLGSHDKAFKVFYEHGDQVDKVSERDAGYAKAVVEDVILKEELLPRLWLDKAHRVPVAANPDWAALHGIVQTKYGQAYADLTIDFEKIAYYRVTKRWPELIEAEIKAIEKDFFDNNGVMVPAKMERLNDLIYDHIFFHTNDKKILAKALAWEKQIVDKNPDDDSDLDTYANLLHKTGLRKDAIVWEEKAIAIKSDKVEEIARQYKNNPANQGYVDSKRKELQDMKDNLQKIRKGQPTWQMKED
jgi:thiol-disulfide isomerase/thioredoxin